MGKDYQAFVVSAPEGSDLLDESNWTMSNKLLYPSSVKPSDTPMVNEKGWLEGNMAVDPDGNVLNLLRFNSDPRRSRAGYALLMYRLTEKQYPLTKKTDFPS